MATDIGFDTHCWQLAYSLRGYYFLTKRFAPWENTYNLALTATRRLRDRAAEGQIVNGLGLLSIELGNAERAEAHYREAFQIFREIGDEHGEHTASANIAWIAFNEGRYRDFVDSLRTAHAFYERVGSVRNAAITLRGISLGELELGHDADAVPPLPPGPGGVLRPRPRTRRRHDTERPRRSVRSIGGTRSAPGGVFERGLASSIRCGSRFEQARAHRGLGDLAETGGDQATAAAHWAHALSGYEALGAPQAAELRRKLSGRDMGRSLD